MNITQYREMIAEEERLSKEQPQTSTAKEIKEEIKTEVKQEEKIPEKIKIDGVGEVSIEELKGSYFRQSDYTKKTQALSARAKEVEDAVILFDFLKANPELAKELATKAPNQAKSVDPSEIKLKELESKMEEMKMLSEVEKLSTKYPDFDITKVLEVSKEKHVSLEDAYKLLPKETITSKVDEVELEKQIRAKILEELKKEALGTRTIISSTGNKAVPTALNNTLTEGEKRVARNMRMSDDDYLKWKNVGSKKT